MINKKLIFIVGAARSGSTLLLSYFLGLPNTKVLYETLLLKNSVKGRSLDKHLENLAHYFDSFEEEIIIEKTPCHCLYLEDIENLRKLCKRDIYIIYIVRPPVPTVLSMLKAAKDSPHLFGEMDLLGACERYEQSLLGIYNNLILKSNEFNVHKVTEEDSFVRSEIPIPYSFCISYRELIENPYRVLNTLLTSLYVECDIQSLIDNRITNTRKYLPIVSTERHHVNVLRDIQDVEVERRANIGKQINEGFSDRYIERSKYIRNYNEHPITKETIYDLIVEKKLILPMDNPEVYVIVPLYNKQDYIEETLTSIANQTYKNIRVVVIDDASTDKSAEVAKRFIDSLSVELREKFSLIKYTNNRGVSYIRNRGLVLCTGILTFCDADDIWDRELIQKSVDTFIKYPYVDCVYSRVIHKKNNKYELDKSKICNGNVFSDATKFNFLTCGSNLLIRKQVLEENNIQFDLSFNGVEDWDFLIQLSKVAVFKCTKEYLVTYRHLPNSLSSNNKEQVDQGRTILKRYIEDEKEYSRTLTRLFLHYFSTKNMTKKNLKDLDYRFILEVILDKLKSYVKSCIS